MDFVGGSSLYPLNRCKTLHVVRHAQGIHNVEGDKNYKAYMSPEYFDAHLTQLGWQQVDNLRKHVHASGLFKRIDLVITSPLLRTMQTAVGVFGGDGYTDRMDVLPLMVANAGNSRRSAISSLNCPPIIAVELCREHLHLQNAFRFRNVSLHMHPSSSVSLLSNRLSVVLTEELANRRSLFVSGGLEPTLGYKLRTYGASPSQHSQNLSQCLRFSSKGVHPCDKRRSISEYQCLFPAVDFSLIESDEDVVWKADVRETKEELAARGMKFMNWLWTRKEKEIAIVTHSGFLFHTLTRYGNDCHPSVKKEIAKHFANCELRSMVIVDKSMLGSDTATTNYPGKIPPGPDLPSDAADEKIKQDGQDSGLT